MIITPLYIFDLDGTLSDFSHRLHILKDIGSGADCHEWDRFDMLCHRDTPHYTVLDVMKRLITTGADCWVWTARHENYRRQTIEWLRAWTPFDESALRGHILTMRPKGENCGAHELKERWLYGMPRDDRQRLVGAFEDNECVVSMWRRNGVQCFQVAPDPKDL